MIELIEMVEKHNTQVTKKIIILVFVFWNISFKVCNNACIMPRFVKNHFWPFLLGVFKNE